MSAPVPIGRAALSRPETTRLVARGAARLMRTLGHAVVSEMTFANGRRADLVALAGGGEITVVEVKSGALDYLTDGKWPDYRDFCDRLFFAVSPDFPVELLPEEVGLIVADAFGGAIIREAPTHALAPARRRALLLAFARLAADRLALMTDPNPLGI